MAERNPGRQEEQQQLQEDDDGGVQIQLQHRLRQRGLQQGQGEPTGSVGRGDERIICSFDTFPISLKMHL